MSYENLLGSQYLLYVSIVSYIDVPADLLWYSHNVKCCTTQPSCQNAT